MIISDLSYLNEISEETIFGATGAPKYNFSFAKKINVEVDVDIDQNVKAKGAYNELYFDLTALGKFGSGTEVAVTQTAVYDDEYKAYVSAQEGTIISYSSSYPSYHH